jgi:hypothetical protein
MNIREKADCIRQYKRLNNQINRLLEEKDKWQSRAEKTTPTISDMPHGGDGEDPRELAICNMVDCDNEANQFIDQLNLLREQVNHYILTTGDSDESLLVVLQIEK